MKELLITGLASCMVLLTPACSNNSLGEEPNVRPNQRSVKETVSYCFVYCDFTKSMNKDAHEKIIKNALAIYDSLNKGHRLFFFTIGNNSFSDPIFTCSLNEDRLMSPVMRTQINQAREGLRDTLRARLWEAKGKERSVTTCIISNVRQSVQNCLNINEDGEGNFKIIFLSDMLENCKGISIQGGQYKKAEESIEKLEITDDFSKFKNLKIAIVVSSSNEKGNEQLGDFWIKVFKKFNYRGPKVRLSSMIPWEKLR